MKLVMFFGLLTCSTSFAESWKPYYDAAITAKSEKYQSDTSPVGAVYANWLDVSSTPSVGVLVKKSGENKLELLATCTPDMNTKCLAMVEVSASGLLVRDLAENSQVTFPNKIEGDFEWFSQINLSTPYRVRVGFNSGGNSYRLMVYDNNVNLNDDPRAKIRFYPYQESYRIPVTLQEDPSVSSEASDDKKYFVTFELHGKPYRLHFKSYSRADGNASFFITDETSNKPGYTGGRMMSFQFKANMQVGEQDEIDLNFLEYPPCKVNSFFACDATTDHLPILIEAGEQSWED